MTSLRRVDELRAALAPGRLVHAPGVLDPFSGRLAARAGATTLYLSGAVASATVLGRPDLGYVTGVEIAELGGRITQATGLPLVADADAGYGNAVHVAATVRRYVAAGIAGLHLEDQVSPKRCGHLTGKQVLPLAEAREKVVAAVEAAAGEVLVIARTDAWSVEGPASAVERAAEFAAAGADLVFVEGVTDEDDLARVRGGIGVDVGLVLNRSEAQGDVRPLPDEVLRANDVRLVIHPVSALLAAARSMAAVFAEVVGTGRVSQPRLPWSEANEVLGLADVLDLERRHAGDVGSVQAPATTPTTAGGTR